MPIGGDAIRGHVPVPDAHAVARRHGKIQAVRRLGPCAFGQDPIRCLARDAQKPDDTPVGIKGRGIGKGPIAFLGQSGAAQIQPHIHDLLAFAAQASLDQGQDVVPDAFPDLAERPAKRVACPITQDRNISIVIERDEVRSPGQIHGRRASQHRGQDRAQVGGP